MVDTVHDEPQGALRPARQHARLEDQLAPGKRLVHALELAQLQRVGSPAGHATERGEGGGRIAEKPPRGIGRIACRREEDAGRRRFPRQRVRDIVFEDDAAALAGGKRIGAARIPCKAGAQGRRGRTGRRRLACADVMSGKLGARGRDHAKVRAGGFAVKREFEAEWLVDRAERQTLRHGQQTLETVSAQQGRWKQPPHSREKVPESQAIIHAGAGSPPEAAGFVIYIACFFRHFFFQLLDARAIYRMMVGRQLLSCKCRGLVPE